MYLCERMLVSCRVDSPRLDAPQAIRLSPQAAAVSPPPPSPPPQFHFTRTQIVQQWNRVVEHDVLPAPLNLVHLMTCLLVRMCVSKDRYPVYVMRIGCFLFWLVMGPLGAALAITMWLVSIPWSIWHLCFGGQVRVPACQFFLAFFFARRRGR